MTDNSQGQQAALDKASREAIKMMLGQAPLDAQHRLLKRIEDREPILVSGDIYRSGSLLEGGHSGFTEYG